MKKYIPQEFESNRVATWLRENTYKTSDTPEKEKEYVLVMFPYPSGAGLHVGHVRVYTGTDVLARYFRMNGKSVLHPMGWDAFGLPAENAAIKAKTNPKQLVPKYIATFKRQVQMLGLSYDWNRELATVDPTYYKWTQWLFITFFKMGLLYKQNTSVYFCEFCKTGLAEEEVLADGTHERCQKQITRRDLPQWMFRITSYADRLETELKGLDWPKGILEMQKNWIGRKEGINIKYKIVDSLKSKVESSGIDEVVCFTTRPDTNFGATFVVLAPEHTFVKKIIDGVHKIDQKIKNEVENYVKKSLAKTDVERQTEGKKKTGAFTGFYAVNNLNGRRMPIWVSDFVLSGFGTGAVVGVPAHDTRDFEFAQEFGLDVIRVVEVDGDSSPITKLEQVQEEFGTMINSGFLNGMNIHDATKKVMDHLEEKGWGERVVTHHLRDWIFSRQRYWGEPIPMVYCEACAKKGISWWDTEIGKQEVESLKSKVYTAHEENQPTNIYQNITKNIKETQKSLPGWFPIDQKSLPLELPDLESYEPDGTGRSPLAQDTEWMKASCPNCGKPAVREGDTMPNWAGSCWYFLYFAIPSEQRKMLGFEESNNVIDNKSVRTWLPVDWYLGGAEHAVLHLLYSRFWIKALNDIGLVDFIEPFKRLRTVGIVLAEDHRKMSKSWGNVINPDDVVAEYGTDTLRVYEMFMAPFNQEIAWSTTALAGAYRFLKRIWNLYHDQYEPKEESDGSVKHHEDKKLLAELNRTIIKVTRDIPEIKYNTSIAAMMEFLNMWEKAIGSPKSHVHHPVISRANAKKFLQILAPFAPFLAEELWQTILKEKISIHLSGWPKADESVLHQANVSIPVQVSGKVRSVITISSRSLTQADVVAAAEADPKIQKYLVGKSYEVVYIHGRVLNFVITV